MRCAAIVPAYQAATGLAQLLPRLREFFPDGAIFVVDDGSQDGSAEVADAARVRVLRHAQNRGKGSALMTGFATAAQEGFSHALCLDADGQHLPDPIPLFLACGEDPAIGVVVGARRLAPPRMPWPRVCSNRITTFLLGLQAGTALFDSQCGYRLYRLDAVLHPSMPREGRFEWESEALVRIARHGWGVASVPVPTVYGDEESHIRPWRDTARFVRLWFRLWICLPGICRERLR